MQRLHDPIAWLTAITAVLALLIAYRQHRTAQIKLRLDLFEKRYAVYQPAIALITSVVQNRDVTIDQVVMYNAATNDAGFLFENEIVEFLAEVRSEAISLSAGNANLRDGTVPTDKDRDTLIRERSERLAWFLQQIETAQKLFGRYLSFRRIY